MDEPSAKLLKSLIAMANADGRIGMREERFIKLVMGKFGVPAEDVQRQIERCRSKRLFPVLPDDPSEKRFLLNMLIKLAAVDNYIHPGERQMLESMALHCRIDLEEVEEMIEEALVKIQTQSSLKRPDPKERTN
jgi:uncharacterized tellurite resistance protein B-like protein